MKECVNNATVEPAVLCALWRKNMSPWPLYMNSLIGKRN